jgi:hypothetical protein
MSASYLHALSPSGGLIPLICDADGRLYVEGQIALDALPAGTNTIGATYSNSVVKSATIQRPADTTAYAALDVIAPGVVNESNPGYFIFSGMARANGGTGTIVRARLMTDNAAWAAAMQLHLYTAAPTAIADNAQYTLLYADVAKRIGSIKFPALSTEGTGSTAAVAMRPSPDGAYSPPWLKYKCASADTALYGILTTLDGVTPASAQNFYIELGADGLS